ncbi:nitroreductase / dihydropteridine reductase [Chryseobacterium sp. RU37D]|uniref:nitroreductase family protein n=1 Tax=Chryseobacterium sp. RU37D TaxID=1907397 RepID=UPI00095723CA|nr:nitroreductase family protein [Chryseobacterium sp. RU37D]SIQ41240.1 nitroreductase / dihydropteridine reductase [Chryseobacterium sp. RU37D]
MNFLEQMKKRYTVKKYDPQGTISEEQIQTLKEILHLSPSSINSQPWNFVFVNNSETKEKLAEVSYFNKEKILDSSYLIVFQVIKNPEDFEKQIKENLPEGSINYYKTFVKPKGEVEIKSWLKHQVYLSLGVLLSACAMMEIDSTPMEGIENDKYDTILNNKKYESLFAVTIGVKSENDKNQPIHTPKKRLESKKIILEF